MENESPGSKIVDPQGFVKVRKNSSETAATPGPPPGAVVAIVKYIL